MAKNKKKKDMAENGQARIPIWLVGILFTIFGAIVMGAMVWGQARADVDSLKKDVAEMKPLENAVAILNTQLPSLSKQIDTLAAGQVSLQQTQMQMQIAQTAIQADIKTLLNMKERERN